MAGAENVLQKALAVDPGLAKTHFFLATALKSLGRYDEAIAHLRTAPSQYPRDRVVLNQIGRVLFLKRQYKDAVAELQQVLAIDPEDLQAHYNLMLVLPGAGRRGRGRPGAHVVRALQGGRIVADDHRALPAAPPRRQQRAAADPRAPRR